MIDQPNTPGQVNPIRRKSRLGGFIGRFIRDHRGNMGPLVALMLVPLIGVMGMASETGSWFMVQRSMQNAADSAALAAANNGVINANGTTYITEAKSVTANYGFVDGASNTTVTPLNGQTCPAPLSGSGCYKVTISRDIPIYLTQIVGYSGTVALGSGRGQTVTALAIAGPTSIPISDCILSLGTSNQAYRVNGNGGNSINLNNCAVQDNGGAKCAGTNADANASYYFVSGNNDSCDPAAPNSPSPQVADPYTAIYPPTNIPNNTCNLTGSPTDYWQENNNYGTDAKNKTISLSQNTPPSKNTLSGTAALSATPYCGDVTLTADTTLTGSGTMVIENGQLDLNGHTLTASGVAIIFTGPTVGNNFNPSHTPPTNGTLDVSAPPAGSGSWSGVAIYQDPNLTSGVDWTSSGNSLNWDITGLIYMPNSNITFSGTINKASSGVNCISIVTKTILLSGTVSLGETQAQCPAAGLNTLPTSIAPRVVLVQ